MELQTKVNSVNACNNDKYKVSVFCQDKRATVCYNDITNIRPNV